MADLKINQLDPIIYVSSGSGAAFNALSDSDLFIVKMKVRGTAIGDEDRKLTWLELRNSLNLGQYMPTVGGNFTGDITLNNSKAVKAQQVGSGADISLLVVDSANRVNIGATTNLTRVLSSSVPQFVDGTGTYNFITAKNLPTPGDINAYSKTEVENKLATKFDKAGGDVSGDINLTQNATRLYGYTTDGLKASLAYVTAGNTVNFGHSTLHTNLVSTDAPGWTNGSQTYEIITRGNLPVPGDINAYTKAEVDAIAAQKLNLSGGEMSGNLTIGLNKSLFVREAANVTRVGISAVPGLSSLQIGDPSSNLTIKMKSAQNPTVAVGGGSEYTLYHGGNKPSAADLGFDTLLDAKMDKAGGTFTGNVTLNNAVRLSSVSGSGAVTPNTTVDVAYSGTDGLYVGDVKQKTTIVGSGNLVFNNGLPYNVYHTGYKPSATDVGAYSKSEADGLYARKGVNADITALNALTGALKVGADGTEDLHVPTMRQLRIATGSTAGAVVGVVGGFVGAVMWFNGPRDRVPAGWLPADGQLLKRTDAPDLWNAVSNGSFANCTEALWQNSGEGSDSSQQSNATQRGKYSLGDGSTTFRLPDLNGGQSGSIANAYLRGYGTAGDQSIIGKMHLDGAPNITGGFTTKVPDGHTSYTRGAFVGSSGDGTSSTTTPATYTSIAGSGNNVDNNRYGYVLNANLSYSGYGRSNTEIRPRSAVGIWIIRVSNNFEAANTQFSVYNGAATLPASGTTTNAGSLRSLYNVNGVEDHSMTLQSVRDVGSESYAALTVTQQAQGSQVFQSSVFKFGSNGSLNVPGASGITTTKLELSAPQPFIDFHYGNSTADYTHRIIADTASRLNVTTDLSVNGQVSGSSFGTPGTVIANGQIQSNTSLMVSGAGGAASSQGMYMRWNEDGNTGKGSIIVNPGGGTGGMRIRFINQPNTTQTGSIEFFPNGRMAPSQGYCSKAGLNGSINTSNSWNIERGGDGNNYLWIDTTAFLIPQSTSDLNYKTNVTKSKAGALDRVVASETIEYEWEDKSRGKGRRRGFGAQTQEVVDEMHIVPSAGKDYPMSLDTTAMLADAYDAIKTLNDMISDLREEIAELKAAGK